MAVDTLNPGIARRFRGKGRQSQDPEFSACKTGMDLLVDGGDSDSMKELSSANTTWLGTLDSILVPRNVRL